MQLFRTLCFLFFISNGITVLAKNNRVKGAWHPPTSQPTAAWVASCRQYQGTEASVEAIFVSSTKDDAEDIAYQRVMVTDIVGLKSGAPDVASMEGHNRVVGHEAGESIITVDSNLTKNKRVHINPATVTVSQDAVKLESLQISAITGSKNRSTNNGDLYGGSSFTFDLYQNLTYDLMTAGISVFANYSDGTWNDVTLNSTIGSLSGQLTTSYDAYGPMLTVSEYAHKEEGGLIEASFPICHRNESVHNVGYVDINVVPVFVNIVAEFDALSNPYDYAAFYPFNLPQSTYLSVQVVFADGNVKNFTDGFAPGLNPRCTLSLINGTELVYIEDNLITAWDDALNGTVMIEATFPGLYNITGHTTIVTANFDYSGILFTSYPYTDGILKNTIYLNSCSSSQQRIMVIAVGLLTNDIVKDVTFNATFEGDLNGDAGSGYLYHPDENTTVFVGESPGEAFIRAIYQGEFVSEWEEIHVVNASTDVIGLESYGHAPNDTLRGFAYSEWDFYKLRVYFDDGTIYPEIIHGITYEWLKPNQIVWFNSSKGGAALMNQSTAVVTLIGNYYAEIYLEAVDNCTDSSIRDSVIVYSNLMPRGFDIDMGSTVGPKFGTKLVGEPVYVPMGVQADSEIPLTTFDMVLKFDNELISVENDDSCASDESWNGYFECTANNPPGTVIVSGICPSGDCTMVDFVNFANVKFTANAVGMTPVYGEVRRVGDASASVKNLTIVAGADDMLLATGTPTSVPSGAPSGSPTSVPTSSPTSTPSGYPTSVPTRKPTFRPSATPTVTPTFHPTATPTFRPSAVPTATPTFRPSAVPTVYPTPKPSAAPTFKPTKVPTAKPTKKPSSEPTFKPTKTPTFMPTKKPSSEPTFKPTKKPSFEPTRKPSMEPTFRPTKPPTASPSFKPTKMPTANPTRKPSAEPTFKPTKYPTFKPTFGPTHEPSYRPTKTPTVAPSKKKIVSMAPTSMPSSVPSQIPTSLPTFLVPKDFAVDTTCGSTIKASLTAQLVGNSEICTSFPAYGSVTDILSSITVLSNAKSVRYAVIVSTPFEKRSMEFASVDYDFANYSEFSSTTRFAIFSPWQIEVLLGKNTYLRSKLALDELEGIGLFKVCLANLDSGTSTPVSFRGQIMIPSLTYDCDIPIDGSFELSSPPTSSPTTGTPTSLPTYVVPDNYFTFSKVCNERIVGTVKVDMIGSSEICAFFPASGSVSNIVVSMNEISQAPVTFALVVSTPFETASMKFSHNDLDFSDLSQFSISTVEANYSNWQIEISFGTSSYSKVVLSEDVLKGIGLFKVCLANLDSGTSAPVSFRGQIMIPSLTYDCDIPIDGSFELSSPPTSSPTKVPSMSPTPAPSAMGVHTAYPSSVPSGIPTRSPVVLYPTYLPSCGPTQIPSGELLVVPSRIPSCSPTAPSFVPSNSPTAPSFAPSSSVTAPSFAPSSSPTAPSFVPSSSPTAPSFAPSSSPTAPSFVPSSSPTAPSFAPSSSPTAPSFTPSSQHSQTPTGLPTCTPVPLRTSTPTVSPTSSQPSGRPTAVPSSSPAANPTHVPSNVPSHAPTGQPFGQPSANPTGSPTSFPTCYPSMRPTGSPTVAPSLYPTSPTSVPSVVPTGQPTLVPSSAPTRPVEVAHGVSFTPMCDAVVSGTIYFGDVPYNREGCGFFPGRGVLDVAHIDVKFVSNSATPASNAMQFVFGRYEFGNISQLAYIYGDEYVDISNKGASSGGTYSDVVANATFVNFGFNGSDPVDGMSRVATGPSSGDMALAGENWYKVCIVNVDWQTNSEIEVRGTISIPNMRYDCNSLLFNNIPFDRRRKLSVVPVEKDVVVSDTITVNDEMNAHKRGDSSFVSPVDNTAAIYTPLDQWNEIRNLKNLLHQRNPWYLIQLLQNTVGLFTSSGQNYYHYSKQQTLKTLAAADEDDVAVLYKVPKVHDYRFAPYAQTFTVPRGVYSLTVYACGASGGDSMGNLGGLGGCVSSILSVEPKQSLYLHVGGQGDNSGAAGFFGGGLGSSATLGAGGISDSAGGAGGGGSTDVRLHLGDISSRIIVAGGGGGAGNQLNASGGPGGGYMGGFSGSLANNSTGGSRLEEYQSFTQLSYEYEGATQFVASGGMQGHGGLGGKFNSLSCGLNGYLYSGGASTVGGGGGGGYYGGGGGCYSGGAGGSSFAYGSVIHNFQGIHKGNGLIRLTYNKPTTRRRPTAAVELMPITPTYQIQEHQDPSPFLPLDEETVDSVAVPRDVTKHVDIENIRGAGAVFNKLSPRQRRLQSVYVDPDEIAACTECVMGDVNGDCIFDAADAKVLEVYVSLQLDRSHLTTCQNTSMDPNRDGVIDKLDVIYLMRVNNRKYRFISHMEAEYDLTGIRFNADLYRETGDLVDDVLTYAEFSIGTAYGDWFNFVQGTDPVLYPWGVHIIPEFDKSTQRFVAATDGGINEPNMEVAMIVITYDELGATSSSRQYVYFCSPLLSGSLCESKTKTHGNSNKTKVPQSLEPYLAFDVTGYPTARPSASPSFSAAPSFSPTSHPTATVVDFATIVHQIHPEITALDSNGTMLPVHSFTTLNGFAKWSLPFKQLLGAAPGAETTFGLSVAGRQYGSTTVAVASNRAIAFVHSVVKTSTLYVDNRTLSVAYQATDMIGHTQIDTSTEITMYVNNSILNMYAAFSCYSPHPISGIGSCVGDIDSSWFTATNSISIDVTIGTPLAAVRSPYVAVVLQKIPVTSFVDPDPYVLMELPRSPLMPGDNFTVSVLANTAGHHLTSWMLTLQYSTQLLSYHSTSISSMYANTETIKASNLVVLSSGGLQSNVAMNDTVGDAIEMAYITFFVLKNVTNGVYSNSMNLYVNAMNASGVKFYGGSYSYVQDGRDHGDFINGQLLVYASSYVGVMAYSSQNELLNTATLNGMDVYSNINVEGIRNGTDTMNDFVTTDSTCQVSNEALQSMDIVTNDGLPCVVKLSAYKVTGSADAQVEVSYNNMQASVPFRIWYPSTVEVMVEDDVLSRITIN